jgi:hypothetical protein
MGIGYNPKIVTDGLVLCLDAANRKSYPGSGTTWIDLSGRNNNGTLTNGPTYSSNNGGGIVLDGTNDYVNLSIANPYAETIMVIAKSNTTNWDEYGWISSTRGVNGHIIHPNIGSKSIDYFIFNQSGTYTFLNTYTPSDITIPHMYCFSTNGSNSHKIHFDGSLIVENTTSITRSLTPPSVTYVVGKDDTLQRYGNGVIYTVHRYNIQLSDAEIQQNFQALRGRYGI